MSVDYSEDSEKSEMVFHHPLELITAEVANTKEKTEDLEILLDSNSEEKVCKIHLTVMQIRQKK